MRIAGIEISNHQKILFPKKEITKGQMVSYYHRIAPLMLPYLKDRPLTLHRFPDGIDHAGFYQKNASEHFPDFIQTIEVPTEDGSNTQIICNDIKSLIYLANQGTVAFHIWMSKKNHLRQPDKVVFDLDPSDADFNRIREAAKVLRIFLLKKDIDPSLMTSGKNGLHLYYSINKNKDFDQIKEEVKTLAQQATEERPDLFTTKIRKDQGQNKIFLDYLRNAYAQTAVCPYSLRATEEAGVATPLEWDEISKVQSASQYHIKNIFRRTGQKNKT